MKYRIFQEEEKCFLIQYKVGWFWWALTKPAYGGDVIVGFYTMEGAMKEIERLKVLDAESEKTRNFKKRIFEIV